MKNQESNLEVMSGEFKILLGGLRSSHEVSKGIKINKTGISIGIGTCEKIGLKTNNYIAFGQMKERFVILFSEKRKEGFIKVTNSQNKNYLSCSLNGINKKMAIGFLGIYEVVKVANYQQDKSVFVVLLEKE